MPRRADRTRLTVAGGSPGRRAWARMTSAGWGTSSEEPYKPDPLRIFHCLAVASRTGRTPTYLLGTPGLGAAGDEWWAAPARARHAWADLPCSPDDRHSAVAGRAADPCRCAGGT